MLDYLEAGNPARALENKEFSFDEFIQNYVIRKSRRKLFSFSTHADFVFFILILAHIYGSRHHNL